MRKNTLFFFLLTGFLVVFCCSKSSATHVIGATINYTYAGGNDYNVTVYLYRDCRKGNAVAPDSIALTVRRSDGQSFIFIMKKKGKAVSIPLPLPDPCAEPPAVQACVEQYEYSRTISGILAGYDHYLFFSTRARNAIIANLNNPSGQAETVYTKIPDRNTTPNKSNAQFVSAPPPYVCGGRAFTVKDSSYDADGDKITYQLYSVKGGNYATIPGTDTELHNYLPGIYIPTVTNGYPDFVDLKYVSPYTYKSPMNASEVLDTTTGKLTINGNVYGQFIVGVKLREYRAGKLISETFRDYQYNIVNCPPPSKSVLALSNVCNSLTVQPTNSGVYYPSTTFSWKFNDPAKAPNDVSTKQTPSYTYSKPGAYKIKLIVNPGSACRDSSEFNIKVSDIKSAFKVTSDTCVKVPIVFTNNSTASAVAPITGYKWTFGDGGTSIAISPSHSYASGGSYNIKLIVTNSIGCVDSSAGVIKVIQDYPVAMPGNQDTICRNNPVAQLNGAVKNAGGGIWSGGAGLFDPSNTSLSAKYYPTTTELAKGSLKLKLTTTQNGKCGLDSSSVVLKFYDPPKVLPYITAPYSPICSNNPFVSLQGKVLPDTMGYGVKWRAGGGKFSDSTDAFATYVPSASEISAGKVNLTIFSTKNGKCNAVSSVTTIAINPAPVVFAGNDTTVCANNADVKLKGTSTLISKVLWSTNGDGTFVGGNTILSPTYRPGTSDKNNGIVRLILKTNDPGTAYPKNCQTVGDTMFITITPAPVVKAGADQTLCENNPKASLSGQVTIFGANSTGKWITGKGTFSPSVTDLSMQYTPSDSEVTAKSVQLILMSTTNGKCLASYDTVKLSFTPKPAVDAGTTALICKNNSIIKLNGSVTAGASTGVWSGGKGVYTTDSTQLKASYKPTATELSAGSVKLTLKSTNNGKCLQEKDTVTYKFNDVPQIDAGSPITACKNNSKVKLNATIIKGATGIKWTGGAGTFSPNDSTLNAEYQATTTEINTGKVILTATSTGVGNCNPVTDTVSIKFINSPTVNPGSAGPVCANNSDIKLNGSTSTGKGIWSSSTGGQFLPNASQLNATYIPSSTDSTSSNVTLTLTSDNNGLCLAESSTVTVTITKVPVVNAGPQQNICSNNATIQLAGSVTAGASTGIWSGGTNNFQGGNTNLSAKYVPSATEIAAGKVTLTLTSTNYGNCNAVADTATFYFTPAPVVDPGGDQTVCGDVGIVNLAGTSSTNAGIWKTSGTGKFTDSTKLSTTYSPSQMDVDNNSVTLTLKSANNGNCIGTSKSMVLKFSIKPTADAGNDITYCTADSILQLNATGSPGKWSTTTGGTFSPSVNAQNATYKPTTTEKNSANFTLTFTSNASGACPSVKDDVKITVIKSPTSNPGTDKTICSDQNVSLSGTVQNAGALKWTSSGTGTFTASDTTKMPTYKPSAKDISDGKVIITLSALSSQCPNSGKSIVITINPKYDVNAGGNRSICSDIKQIDLAGSRSANFPVKWTSSVSGGQFVPSDTVPNASYLPSAAALSGTSFDLTLKSTGTGCPNKTSKITVSVTAAPLVEAGSDMTICNDTANVKLTGKLLNGTATGGYWSTTAGGVLNPNSLSATYTPTVGEKGQFKFYLNSTGGICNAAKDSMTLTINDKPSLSLSDGKVCADKDTISLNASFTNATGGKWTVTTGNGTLGNSTSANAFYLPSSADKSNGLVSFSFKTNASSDGCKPISKQLSYEITPAPTVFAGADLEYCANAASVPLTGTVQRVDSVRWSTLGSGTFTTPKSLSAAYKFSSGDTAAKSVKVVLTSYPTALCKAKSDTLLIKIDPQPKVTVPADFTVCADTSLIRLAGTSSTGSGVWSTNGEGPFSTSASQLSVKYLPTGNDLKKTSLTFTLTSANSSPCGNSSKSMTVTITPAPKISAGTDQSVCSDAGTIKLTASPSTGQGVQWTSSGSGNFVSTGTKTGNTANDNYLITAIDTAAKTVIFTAKTTNNGLCKAVTSQVKATIIPQPYVDAGPASATICGDVKSYALSGKTKNTKSVKWSTTGTGKFASSDSTLTPNYLISSADSLAGKVNLILSGKGNGTCSTYRDTLKLTITPAPKVVVSDDKTICADKDTLKVYGTKLAATGVIWSTSGKGKFSTSATLLQPVYEIAAADKSAGKVVLRMTATGISTCKPVSDSLVITINPAPTVDAGDDGNYCASVKEVNLQGNFKVAPGVLWTTSGTGKFDDSSYVSTVYTPSTADKDARTVTLTLTTVNNGLCKAVNDKIVLSFTPVPEANAGADQLLCKDAGQVVLAGKVKNSSLGQWLMLDGNGQFSTEPTSPGISYVFTSQDTARSSLSFTYSTINNGVCPSVSDTVIVKFLPVPKVNAGNDQAICSNAKQIKINGSYSNASGAVWSTNGSNPVVATGTGLESVYAISATDIAKGTVKFTLTSQSANGCKAYSDDMLVSIQKAPVVLSIPSYDICTDTAGVQLVPDTANVGSFTWSTLAGTSMFSPSNTAFSPKFVPIASQVNDKSVIINLTAKGKGACATVSAQASTTITIVDVPKLTVPDVSICQGGDTVSLNASNDNGIATAYQWSSLSASPGTFTNATALSNQYVTSAQERTLVNTSIQLLFKTTAQGKCKPVSKIVELHFTPTSSVSAGSDQTTCTNQDSVRLNASGSSEGVWSRITATGIGGTFKPSATSPTASYFFSPDDETEHVVLLEFKSKTQGTCLEKRDTMALTINPGPTFDPGTDRTVCANKGQVSLNANNSPSSKVVWFSNGSGTFADSTASSTSYSFSSDDISARGLFLKARVLDITELCKPEFKQFKLAITPAPVLDAGSDLTVCGNAKQVPVSGIITQSTSVAGQWTAIGAASGSFTSTSSTTSASEEDTYIPSSDDKNAGQVTLVLMADDNGNCNLVSDTLLLKFGPEPTVVAGRSMDVCGDTSAVALNATITVANGGIWTTDGKGQIMDPSSVSTQYVPSDQEKDNGATINLYITSNAQGTCLSVKDSLVLSIASRPLLDRGFDVTVCGDTSFVKLDGSVSNALGSWSVIKGFGHFASNGQAFTGDLQDKYIPSSKDLTDGTVLLRLDAASSFSLCKSVSDIKLIKLTPLPQVFAGSDLQVCANNRVVNLSGSLLNKVATGGAWATLGQGTFSPKSDTLVTTYVPSTQDSTSGQVSLIVQTTGNGQCKAAKDTLLVTITPSPDVTVSSNMTLCADSSTLKISGDFTQVTSAKWTTSGSGTFADPTAKATEYYPNGESGIVFLTFQTESGYCQPVSKKIQLDISPKPVVFAGSDTTVCADVASFPMRGTVNSVVTATKWTVANGNAVSSPTSLSFTYQPNDAERDAGAITFQLTSTVQGKCKPVSDVKLVLLQKFPYVSVNAGLPQSICYGTDQMTLNSQLHNVQKASWSSLTTPSFNAGTFIDPKVKITGDTTFGKNEFMPSAFEKGNGKDTSMFQLRLTGTSILGKCLKTVSSDVAIYVIPLPQIAMFGGDSMAVCADKDTVSAHAEAKIGKTSVSGYWTSTGSGTFEPNFFASNAVYRLSAADRLKPSVTLSYHAYGGGCDTVSKNKLLKLVPALPTVYAGVDQKVCKNNLVASLDGNVTVATKYGWSALPIGGAFTPDSNSLQTVFFPTAFMAQNGTVRMRLRSHGPGSCKDVTDDMFISFTEIPKVVIPADSVEICADTDTLSLSASVENATGGVWTSAGSGTFYPSANAISAKYLPSETDKQTGKVRLRLTSTGNGNCLQVTDSILVRIRPRPVVTDTAFSICDNVASLPLQATSTTGSGIWTSTGSGSFSPINTNMNASYYPSFADKKAGRWNLTFTSSNNKTCQPVSKTLVIRLNSAPMADAGHDQLICANTSATIAASTSPAITSYTWNKISPITGPAIDGLALSTGTLTATTTYQLKVGDNNGCFRTDTVVVNVVPKPLIDIALAQYCAYKDTSIRATVTQANPLFGTFQWYMNKVYQSGQNQSSTKIDQTGVYLVTFEIGNCIVSDSSKTVPLPTLQGINKFICANSSTTLSVTSSPVTKYTWKRSSLANTPFSTTTVPQTNDNNIADTTAYYVTGQDANNCLNVDSLVVYTLPKPLFSMKDSVLCAGTPLVLSAQPVNIKADTSRFFYLWSPNGETTATKNVTKASDLAKPDTSFYTVTVKVGNGQGTCDGVAQSKVIYAPIPNFNLPDNNIFCADEASAVIDPGITAAKYEWNTGETTRSIRATATGLYKVKITNGFKCSASDSVYMTEKCSPKVFPPSIFTPNGDGVNDYFTVYGNKFIKNFRLRIYNRWGEVIFDIEDADGSTAINAADNTYSWDGNYRGKPMPAGVYPFLITYEGKDEDNKGPFKKEGSVMVVR